MYFLDFYPVFSQNVSTLSLCTSLTQLNLRTTARDYRSDPNTAANAAWSRIITILSHIHTSLVSLVLDFDFGAYGYCAIPKFMQELRLVETDRHLSDALRRLHRLQEVDVLIRIIYGFEMSEEEEALIESAKDLVRQTLADVVEAGIFTI